MDSFFQAQAEENEGIIVTRLENLPRRDREQGYGSNTD
jgi:hypothetical protein